MYTALFLFIQKSALLLLIHHQMGTNHALLYGETYLASQQLVKTLSKICRELIHIIRVQIDGIPHSLAAVAATGAIRAG